MIAGISVICFAASYGVAWALEVSRLFFQSAARRVVLLIFAAAGFLAQSLYLVHRAYQSAQSPLSSWYDWYLVAAWVLAALYLYLMLWQPRNPIGIFALPCVLALVGLATWSATKDPFPVAEAARAWGLAHGVFLLLGAVAVLVGLMFGLMYLLHAWRLKHKRTNNEGLRLPSLEWLQRMNERAIVASVFLLTLGFLAGIVSNRVNHALVPWTDPVVWSSSLLVGWMILAAAFQTFYKPARTGRKVAYLAVFSAVFLLLMLAVLKLSETAHGTRQGADADQVTAGEAPP
jgi:ABC-type transport system involved in cytochrome c biogenesis permease subunit